MTYSQYAYVETFINEKMAFIKQNTKGRFMWNTRISAIQYQIR